MSTKDLRGVLEDDDHRFGLPAVWPKREWFSVARDRIGKYAAVTRIQRSGANQFFAMTGVYVSTESGWSLEFENGDLWAGSPAEGRPVVGRPFQTLTGVSGAAVGTARQPVAFLAGIVTTSVYGLRASSLVEEHYVEIRAATGIFVALTLQAERPQLTLTALDSDGREIDVVAYSSPFG